MAGGEDGNSVTALAPLPITTARLFAASMAGVKSCECTTRSANFSIPANPG